MQALAEQAKQGIQSILLYASLPIGGIAVCFLGGTYTLLNLPVHLPLLVLGFCATFLVYQVERIAGAQEDQFNHPHRLAWLARHRSYVRLSSLIAAVAAVAVLPLLRLPTLLIGIALAALSALYMVPLGRPRRRLKDHWLLKPLIISLAWSVGGGLLPVVQAGVTITPTVLAFIVYRFLFVLPNTLLSDWPDRAGDAKAGLTTIATRLPLRQIQWVATVSLGFAIAGVLSACLVFNAPWLWLIDGLGLCVMMGLVWRPIPPSRFAFSFPLDMAVAWPAVTACLGWAFG